MLSNKINSIVKINKNQNKNPLYSFTGSKNKSLDVKVSDNPSRGEINMLIDQLKHNDIKTRRLEKVIAYQSENSNKPDKNK